MLAEVVSNTSVGPSVGLVVWTIVAASLVTAGGVTAAKGRWGWLLVGLLTGGLVWLYSVTLPAAPGSLWERRLGAPEPAARADR